MTSVCVYKQRLQVRISQKRITILKQRIGFWSKRHVFREGEGRGGGEGTKLKHTGKRFLASCFTGGCCTEGQRTIPRQELVELPHALVHAPELCVEVLGGAALQLALLHQRN